MSISDSDDRPTPRYQRSVTEDGYFPAPADPDPEVLEAVLEMVPLLDSVSREDARDKLSEIVCNLYTLLPYEEQLRAPAMIRLDRAGQEGAPEPSARTIRPIVSNDLGAGRDMDDLVSLREFLNGVGEDFEGDFEYRTMRAIEDRLDQLYEANPNLESNLRAGLLGFAKRSGVKKQIRSGDCSRAPEIVSAWLSRIEAYALDVQLEIDRGSRRSPRPNLADRTFVFDMARFWFWATGLRPTRSNADGKDSGPFHRFLAAAGQIVVQNFNGKRHAREVHKSLKEQGYFDR